MTRPFCTSTDAAARFDNWRARLEGQGVELNEADLFVVGLLASRESNLEALRQAIASADPVTLVKLELAEDRAARAFGLAMDRAERVFAPRIIEAVEPEAPRAQAPGRVLVMQPRSGDTALDAIVARLLKALDGGVRLTKAELRARVRGSQPEFLRAMNLLVEQGRLVRDGHGRRGRPHTYALCTGGSDVRTA